MVTDPNATSGSAKVCGECRGPCAPDAHACSYCGEPVCEACLVSYTIQSRTHDGWIYHHKACDEKSSAKNFSLPISMR